MTARTLAVLALGAVAALPADAAAQLRGAVRVNPAYESYTFDIPTDAAVRKELSDSGFVFSKFTELAVPVGFDVFFGRRAELSISTGYVSMEGTGFDENRTQKFSGMIDTEARLGINLVPDRLVAVVTGRLPTGTRPTSSETDDDNVGVPGFIAAGGGVVGDVLALTIANFGLGTRLGGGFAGAVPLGRFALGLGATYTHSLAYQPVAGSETDLQLGPEMRVRVGLQGSLARTTFIRTALVYVRRGEDKSRQPLEEWLPQATNTNRFVGYAEVRQGVGNMQLTLYGFDVYRGDAGFDPNYGAILPPGNLLTMGLRHRIPASRSLAISPRAEWRMSTLKPETARDETSATYGSLKKAGQSVRIGLDITQTLSRGLTAELRGSGLFGEVLPLGYKVSTSGWRGSIVLTYRP